jgi:parallel beta-helix repeat protein
VERIKPKFDSAGYFGKGIAPVLMNGKSGLIDRSGTFVLEPRFDLIRTHDNGLSVVSLAGKEGLVDRNGKEILAPEWNIVYVGQSPGGDLPLGFVAGVKRNPAASSLMMLFNEQGRKLWEGNVPTIDEFAPNPDGPRTHQVPANFDTIEKALAQARPGDTVQVGPGTYNGSLTFAPGIRLIGAGAGKTMIRADANQAVLRVHDCSTGLISDVSLEHFGSNNDEQRFPIVSLSNSSVELLRCEIRNSWAHGVISRAGDRSTLTRCTITGSTWSGVAVEDANTTPTFRENRIAENTQVGIYFSPGTGGLAKDNIIESNNSTGIVVRGSNTNPELHGNICRRNLKDGIRFLEGGSGIADGNTCEQNKWCGLAVSGKGSAPALTNNRCNGNVNSGIAIERQCVPVAFSGNTASGNKARTQIDRAASFD